MRGVCSNIGLEGDGSFTPAAETVLPVTCEEAVSITQDFFRTHLEGTVKLSSHCPLGAPAILESIQEIILPGLELLALGGDLTDSLFPDAAAAFDSCRLARASSRRFAQPLGPQEMNQHRTP